MAARKSGIQLAPEVNRILYVRNLPFKITSEEMYDLFGKYGRVRQIRVGDAADTKGTAFVVYDNIYDAKAALERLSGFNLMGRYLIILYYQPKKGLKRSSIVAKEEEVRQLKERLQASESK